MSFKRDNSKVRTFSAGAIKETGFYPGTITKVYDRDSASSDAKAIHIDFVTDSGQYAVIDLWHTAGTGLTTDKNGRDLPAIQTINDLMVLLDIDELTAKRGLVHIYDFDLKQETEVKKMVYPDLINQSIGCVFQMVESDKQMFDSDEKSWGSAFKKGDDGKAILDKYGKKILTGERVCRPEFLQFCDAETMESAAEFLKNEENPIAIEKYIAGLEPIKNSQKVLDKNIMKQAQNQPNAPQTDPVNMGDDDWGDDAPF